LNTDFEGVEAKSAIFGVDSFHPSLPDDFWNKRQSKDRLMEEFLAIQ
jgi:hypothetical protein